MNEEQEAVVRKVFDWYLEGYTVLKIIKKLEEEQISTATGKLKWSKKSTGNMLVNYKYAGSVYLED
ncbi:recombinase family protein [Ligilactobacillus ruminis]|uniref:recombinase family protein n=1 Tax=Ligilactobacillus ruminis TaxID=1623 RepID=UPI0022E80D1A|nr:recombinase family protein [Ligilactobacillus ruminis]